MVDAMAERYGMLPSEIIKKADTTDLLIFDSALTYRNYLEKKAHNKGKLPIDSYSQDQIDKMYKDFKNGSRS